jgi:hypothetical protein
MNPENYPDNRGGLLSVPGSNNHTTLVIRPLAQPNCTILLTKNSWNYPRGEHVKGKKVKTAAQLMQSQQRMLILQCI